MSENRINIGTSGWSYDSWIDDFYPEEMQQESRLSYYAKQFATVELNNSFYQLPDKSSIKAWCEATPSDFIFSCKASRYITHMKKLLEPEDSVNNMMNSLAHFGDKLGPILFQLPPNWHLDIERLTRFIESLSEDYRYSFEFRDKSWFCDAVYELLQKHQMALCFYDLKNYQSPEIITADFLYVRLHGPQKEPYTGLYDGRTLAGHAQKFLRWKSEGKSIYCYLNNDKKACAPKDAKQLLESLERQA